MLVHDWPADSVGQALPYGIYDLARNRGFVRVGDCFDTPRFAVEGIEAWWSDQGCAAYPRAKRLLILADAGGSNSCRSRVWKQQLQERIADQFGLTVTVCHYPSGCSKWNPVEHRLFSFITLNWAGKPLHSFEALMGYINSTATRKGLVVTGVLARGGNETGERVSPDEWATMRVRHHAISPAWNYTIRPRKKAARQPGQAAWEQPG